MIQSGLSFKHSHAFSDVELKEEESDYPPDEESGNDEAAELLFDPQELQMALATTTSLASLTMGDYVVVMNSDFDLTVRGEPYLALMFLLNAKNGRFMAR